MKRLMLAPWLFLSLCAHSEEAQKTNFNEYKNKIAKLASECTAKSMPNFNGLCLSKKYGDLTSTSMTVALQVISFQSFYRKCDHSNFPNGNDLPTRALNIEEASKFHEEMKNQKEALETYSNYFDACKSRDENDQTIAKKLKWFEYMIGKYYEGPILQLTSNQPPTKLVDCILAQYKGTGFLATGLPTKDGGIAIQLIAPEMAPLAIVSTQPEGSVTKYLNVRNKNNKIIPQADIFDSAVNKCQSSS